MCVCEAKTIVYNDSKPVIEWQLNQVYNSEYTNLIVQRVYFYPRASFSFLSKIKYGANLTEVAGHPGSFCLLNYE